MDAVEYEKVRFRMCRTNRLKKGSCEGCGAYNREINKCNFFVALLESQDDEDIIKKNIATVEKWSKDNPIKTRQSEFLKMFPKVPMKDDVIDICPATVVKGLKNAEHCNHILCEDCRKAFWLMEVTDND